MYMKTHVKDNCCSSLFVTPSWLHDFWR